MGLYMIASEENLQHLAHYGVKGMKWGKSKLLDKLYEDSAARSAKQHYKAQALFDMDEKTKKSAFREYTGTTVDGDKYVYDMLKGTYTVYPKKSVLKGNTKEDYEAYLKDMKETEKRLKKKYNQKIQKIQAYY